MANGTQRTLRIGVTVAVALALAMAGTFLIGREQKFWERKQRYEIRFTRINGLRTGSIVTLTGVDIGSVQEVAFPQDPSASYIAVWVSVGSRAAVRIREDSIARIRTIGLLGDKYVEISAGSPQSHPVPAGSIIPSADPIDYEALLGESGDIISNIVETTNSLKNVLASIEQGEGLLGQMVKNREQGAATLGDLQKTVAHVESTTASLERMVKEVESGRGALGVLLRRGDEAKRLVANLDRAAADLATITSRFQNAEGALPKLLQDKRYGEGLLEDLRTTAANLAEVSDKINRGEGTVAKLVNDPTLYRDAKSFVGSARSSWMFSVYRGVLGLFPPYAPPEALEATEAEVSPPLAYPAPSPSP